MYNNSNYQTFLLVGSNCKNINSNWIQNLQSDVLCFKI